MTLEILSHRLCLLGVHSPASGDKLDIQLLFSDYEPCFATDVGNSGAGPDGSGSPNGPNQRCAAVAGFLPIVLLLGRVLQPKFKTRLCMGCFAVFAFPPPPRPPRRPWPRGSPEDHALTTPHLGACLHKPNQTKSDVGEKPTAPCHSSQQTAQCTDPYHHSGVLAVFLLLAIHRASACVHAALTHEPALEHPAGTGVSCQLASHDEGSWGSLHR